MYSKQGTQEEIYTLVLSGTAGEIEVAMAAYGDRELREIAFALESFYGATLAR